MSYSLSKLREGEEEEGEVRKKGGLYGDVSRTHELLKISMLGGLLSQFR